MYSGDDIGYTNNVPFVTKHTKRYVGCVLCLLKIYRPDQKKRYETSRNDPATFGCFIKFFDKHAHLRLVYNK